MTISKIRFKSVPGIEGSHGEAEIVGCGIAHDGGSRTRRIAMDLHDNICQSLAVAKIKLHDLQAGATELI